MSPPLLQREVHYCFRGISSYQEWYNCRFHHPFHASFFHLPDIADDTNNSWLLGLTWATKLWWCKVDAKCIKENVTVMLTGLSSAESQPKLIVYTHLYSVIITHVVSSSHILCSAIITEKMTHHTNWKSINSKIIDSATEELHYLRNLGMLAYKMSWKHKFYTQIVKVKYTEEVWKRLPNLMTSAFSKSSPHNSESKIHPSYWFPSFYTPARKKLVHLVIHMCEFKVTFFFYTMKDLSYTHQFDLQNDTNLPVNRNKNK